MNRRFKQSLIAALFGAALFSPQAASAGRWFGRAKQAPAASASAASATSPMRMGKLEVEMSPKGRKAIKASSMKLHADAIEEHHAGLEAFDAAARAKVHEADTKLSPWGAFNQLVARHQLKEQIARIVNEEANGLHLDELTLTNDWMGVVAGKGTYEDAQQARDAIFARLTSKGKAQDAVARMESRIDAILREAHDALNPKPALPAVAETPAHSAGDEASQEPSENP